MSMISFRPLILIINTSIALLPGLGVELTRGNKIIYKNMAIFVGCDTLSA
ncbi:hypothetical protein COO91_00130 [Nostoc flagelliforme CCNUN1]|uniref:Uncharacterized protein n=1 Tax=Nostoc flagelliforme CCNUN1 TaxID=2038116 RepID=A0A2K8SG21_9NOSO|nr:hypothetical protein COO91_00130 [Nostoc flagelliforme CCNUN1]